MDDRRIYDYYIAGRQSAALAAAVRVGLFDALADGPLALPELARRLAANARGTRILVRVLLAMGLLRSVGECLELEQDARRFLVRDGPEWLGGLIDLEVENFLTPATVLAALRREGASIYAGEDPWQAHARDPTRARAFTEAMHSISVRPAAALARAVDLDGRRQLLDVGGGSGAASIELARAWPELRCTVWELPSVCALAREYVAAAGLEARVEALEGDMFGDRFPEGCDVVLFAQILHDWPPEKGRGLVERAFAALPPGGLLLIHEKLIAPGGPLPNALVDLDMLVWTEGQAWQLEELAALLETAGFRDVEQRDTSGYWSAILARKPG